MPQETDRTAIPWTPALEESLAALAQRQQILPALLLLSGQRPLAFLAGQLMLLLQPLAASLSLENWSAWAQLLNHPDGPAILEARLATLLDSGGPRTRPGAPSPSTHPDPQP